MLPILRLCFIKIPGDPRMPSFMNRKTVMSITVLIMIATVDARQKLEGGKNPSSLSENINAISWPEITQENRPGIRWWWMGSAVDPAGLGRELETFRKAGLGTVEISPVYGAKGYESRFIDFLSPKWMEMLSFAERTARKLDMNVDMSTCTGWCFGGPNVDDRDANASASYTGGKVHQKPSGVKVKRPAPGGEGWMLNPLYPDAMSRYLERFTLAFSRHPAPPPHAQFHDSYEYKSDWAPDFPEQFEKRRGYALGNELEALFKGEGDPDHVARVKGDYRETVSELITESISRWTRWAHGLGSLSRNQAHGSPGNWLDIYAASDIPETEFDFTEPDVLVSKFASSAADTTGRTIVGAEAGTWAAEHFTETLARLKEIADEFFLAGVNRIIWHGAAYSPSDAPWPGWCFYASSEINPRNTLWHDFPALNLYVSRIQGMLQGSRPDNDILLYWPIQDLWHDASGMTQTMSVHSTGWLEGSSFMKSARWLRDHGHAFDYVSDRILTGATVEEGVLRLSHNAWRVVVVPPCVHFPPETMDRLLSLARRGATVIFEERLPDDVPGAADLGSRREELRRLLNTIKLAGPSQGGSARTSLGKGCVIVGDLESALADAGIKGEPLAQRKGLRLLRRATADGNLYFIVNRGTATLDVPAVFARHVKQAVIMDPLDGRIGLAEAMAGGARNASRLMLEPGQSIILRTFRHPVSGIKPWHYQSSDGRSLTLAGTWNISFLEGGPVLSGPISAANLGSWTDLGGPETRSFAGSTLYTLRFDASPILADPSRDVIRGDWSLDLGKVIQSARIRLNGKDLGTVFSEPFRVTVTELKPRENVLEVEVTGTSANRIRDLDLRSVKWRNFHDANVLNTKYAPFDSSAWPVAPQGLLGPVILQTRQ